MACNGRGVSRLAPVLVIAALLLGQQPATATAAGSLGAPRSPHADLQLVQDSEEPPDGGQQAPTAPVPFDQGEPPAPADVPDADPDQEAERQFDAGEPDPDEPAEQDDDGEQEPLDAEPDAEPDAEEEVRPATPPSVTTSPIPLSSILVAVVVLLGGVVVLLALLRTARSGGPARASGRAGRPAPADAQQAAAPQVVEPAPPDPVAAVAQGDRAPLVFLVALGEALLDAGDAVNHVDEALTEVARANGFGEIGVMVLPTALIVSVPGEGAVQTEVTRAGSAALRLDQAEAVFQLVRRARRGELTPRQGIEELARIRAAPPPYSARLRLIGYVAFTLGLALLLRGGWLDVLVAGGLGVVIGGLQLLKTRLDRSYHAFLPVVAGFLAAVVVFSLARALPELSVFPPLVSPLVAFLPGGLLTIAVYELATGQILSGAGRLAAGMLQLLLLALGIVAGAQLVGVPAAALAEAGTSPVSVALPWFGVAVFGVGVLLFNGARASALRWILLVLYVAYAGQVIGGLFLGSSLSAFVGAVVMTPVAMLAARQPTGPPTMISFLPGFWLLVPGAMGLAGVTSLLEEDRVQGIGSLVSMGTSMVGITLGVLLGLAIGTHMTSLVLPSSSRSPQAP